METIDVNKPVIVGAGLAGLATAIELAPLPCLVISAGTLRADTSTDLAQGGVAASMGGDDSAELHAQDTLAAGAGLCDPEVVHKITAAAPGAIDWLISQGVAFDRRADGSLKLGLEGAHSRRRIVHAKGDQTGAEILKALAAKARSLPSITIWENCRALEILTTDKGVVGVRVRARNFQGSEDHDDSVLCTDTVILATGGVGGLFTHTTNPLNSRGQGLALAYRAGAVLQDLEMVQFHPTAMNLGIDPMPLASEAVRGEGAILINEEDKRVLPNPLAARDVVSRAEWRQLQQGHQIFLDARERPGEHFPRLFPSINTQTNAAGIDPRKDLIPVHPAAHYHMGGVAVDMDGASSVSGLYAVGEVAATGLHGANRLASNSLLEAVVCGRCCAQHLKKWQRNLSPKQTLLDPKQALPSPKQALLSYRKGFALQTAQRPNPAQLAAIRSILTQGAGVLRNGAELSEALDQLAEYSETDAGLVAYLITYAALQRQESRGAHTREDFPATETQVRHTLVSQTFLARRNEIAMAGVTR